MEESEEHSLPPVAVDDSVSVGARAESDLFKNSAQALDLSLRRWSARGALVVAALMYTGGLAAILLFVGYFADIPRVKAEDWHLVVSVLVALFSIPTVLLLAVIRSSSNFQKDATADSVHEAIGKKVMGLLDKVTGGSSG